MKTPNEVNFFLNKSAIMRRVEIYNDVFRRIMKIASNAEMTTMMASAHGPV